MRRPLWLGAGVVVGTLGTLWAEQRVKRRLKRLAPDHLGHDALAQVRDIGGRLRAAVDAGRTERARREAELWDEVHRPPERAGSAPHAAGVRRGRRVHRTPR
ncbi:MAG TPA: hypothetical protein VKG43_11055 [Acidimicrobiales bacterium]|nr:hypothetical protein [Acidimicrobiales bacterium]